MRRLMVFAIIVYMCGVGILLGEETARKDETGGAQRKVPIVQVEAFPVDSAFISDIGSSNPFRRDQLIGSRLGALIESAATVRRVEEYPLYKKRYRIIAKMDPTAGITIQYHIYTNDAEYLTFFSEGQQFAFKGQFVMVTPVNSRRDFYIFDVILQEGAAVVE